MFPTVLLIFLRIFPVFSLLHPVPDTGHDKIIKELVANLSQLRQDFEASKIREEELNRTTTLQKKTLNRTIAFLQEDIEFLNQKVISRDKEYNETIGLLKHSFSLREQDMNKTIEHQKQMITDLQSNIQGMNKTNEEAARKTKDSLKDVYNVMNRLNQSFQDEIRDVAFTVSKSTSSEINNKKVVYDKVITNVGNGYSPHTGVFTCPCDGVYVFTWSTMSRYSNEYCYAYIYRNGDQLLMSHSIEAGGGTYEVASNTVVLSLSAGDTVWIQTTTCGYLYGYPYTAFSGWKL